MNTNKSIGIIAVVIIIIAIVVLIVRTHAPVVVSPSQPSQPTETTQPVNTALYSCDAGNTITAAYYNGPSTPSLSPDQPPTPGGSVVLTLSNGSSMTLDQTISADGTRYSNTDGSFVFWSKGNGAMVMENNVQSPTYTGCILVAPEPAGENLPQIYSNSTYNFSLRLPSLIPTGSAIDGYAVDPSYTYQALGPGKDISGVKFTIPASVAAGTNLSNDSYISVEEIPNEQSCTANMFLDLPPAPGATVQTVTDNGTTYSVASYTDAGAGNRYAETVYAIPGTNPCVAVRYYIHYGVIDNYPAGAVKQFDQAALTAQFDQIRRTLTINE